MKVALMYYRKLSKDLGECGFFINPYKHCVVNKWTSEGQLTVVWHINDMKVLHKNKEEVTKFVEYMKGIYGENMPVVRGKKHIYVGMDLDYISSREVIVSMDSYNIEAIDKFPKEMMRTIKTPAGNHRFKVEDTCVKLCKRDKIIFHRLVANILFKRKRARPDC